MSTACLYALPIEVLHRIIDYVDTETIFFSFRNVCRRFYIIINTYNQYQLDFRSITKPAFHHIRHLIQSENVISLIISDEHKTTGQISLFRSLFDISKFTRLRSLSFIQISDPDLVVYLGYAITCPLVSLSIDCRTRHLLLTPAKYDLLSSFIEKLTNLRKLDLTIANLIIQQIRWPTQCQIRHLTLTWCMSNKQMLNIFLYFPHLETLILNGTFMPYINDNLTPPMEIKSKLKSLTMEQGSLYMNMIISILSVTSSLIHLKLTGSPMMFELSWNGYWWAEFIQTNLTQLQIFEFFFNKCIHYKESACDIESIMIPFRTSFWLEKKWYIACDYYKNIHKLELYSIPICKSTISYQSTPNKISCSNLMNNVPYMMDNICSLSFSLTPATNVTDDKNLLPDRLLFSRVTKLTLVITNEFSNGSVDYLSNLIDFSHLDTLSLTLDLGGQSFKNITISINNLLDRACNVQSIDLRSSRSVNLIEYYQTICLMLSNQVKHLTVDMNNIDEIELFLNQFDYFSIITFQTKMNFLPSFDHLIEEFRREGRDFSYCKDLSYISFWFGKQKLNH